MKNYSLVIGMTTIFLAIFMLFFVFDNLEKIADKCKETGAATGVCQHMTAFTMSMIMVLLIISGFILIISVTAYMLLA
jgi:D-alanyl-lipoteichoic acid acyltransferase DltB (MBOAT superfamily)